MQPPLFYVIGPSGAGKDTLIAGAREILGSGRNILFAHRYITRPADAGAENHVALSPDDFQSREEAGLFAVAWRSHGNGYGIGIEVEAWLARGFAVVVNGSRGCLGTAVARFPSLAPVLVTARPELIAERLAARGRESPAAIQERMGRNSAFPDLDHPALQVVDNSASPEEGIAAMVAILTRAALRQGATDA